METPTISKSAYASTSTAPLQMFAVGVGDSTWALKQELDQRVFNHVDRIDDIVRNAKAAQLKGKVEPMSQRRIVQVFIADTDENVPVDKSVIYKGDQKLTDATDQELFFEIDIKKILDDHNAYRTTLVNKKVKERTENLEPVKIRDLKMVVVDIAKF